MERTYLAKEQKVQRSWGREMSRGFQERQGDQCGWNTVSKGMGDFMTGEGKSKKESNFIGHTGSLEGF